MSTARLGLTGEELTVKAAEEEGRGRMKMVTVRTKMGEKPGECREKVDVDEKG